MSQALINPKLLLISTIEVVGRTMMGKFQSLRGFFVFMIDVVKQATRRPFRLRLLFQQLEFIGNQSLVIILISSFSVGAVFGLQIGGIFEVFGAESMMGGVTGKALCMELAPLITAILISGRVGSAITAEISTMKVNEQVDAMEAMAVDPISYLVVPRVVAAALVVPFLCGIFIFIGVIGAFVVGVGFYDVDQGLFIEKITWLVQPDDVMRGLKKSLAFSIITGAIACRYGLMASGGAKGVGRATTNSVVATLLTILSVDVLITYFQVVW